jgi:hypothetical protein
MAKCKQCGVEYDILNARLFSGKCNKCTNYEPKVEKKPAEDSGKSKDDIPIMTILAILGITLYVYWHFSTNDASTDRPSLPLLRFITTILSKGHSHE